MDAALTDAGCGNIGRRINHAPRRTRLPMRPDDPAMLGITLTNSDLDTTDDESEDDGAWLELDDAIDRSGRTHSLSPAGIDWLADLVAFEEAQQAMAARVGVLAPARRSATAAGLGACRCSSTMGFFVPVIRHWLD